MSSTTLTANQSSVLPSIGHPYRFFHFIHKTPLFILYTQVAATGVGSFFSMIGGLIAYGTIRREEGDFLALCGVETLLTSIGVALMFFPAFIRVSEIHFLGEGSSIFMVV